MRQVYFDSTITEGDLRDDPKLFEFLFYQTFMSIKTGDLILTDEQACSVGACWAKINALRTGQPYVSRAHSTQALSPISPPHTGQILFRSALLTGVVTGSRSIAC